MSIRERFSFYQKRETIEQVDEWAEQLGRVTGLEISRNKMLEYVVDRLVELEEITGESPGEILPRLIRELMGNELSAAA